MPSKLEQTFNEQRAAKYGITRLEVEPVRRHLDLTERAETPSQYFQRYKDEQCRKWGMSELAVEGLASRSQTTLSDAVIDHDRREGKHMKLATAKISYQGKPTRLYIEVSK